MKGSDFKQIKLGDEMVITRRGPMNGVRGRVVYIDKDIETVVLEIPRMRSNALSGPYESKELELAYKSFIEFVE